jgi:hypothetical protein
MVDVFVTHYVRRSTRVFNDVLYDVVREIERVTTTPHRLTVVGWAEDDTTWEDAAMRLAVVPGVRLVRNDRPGRADTQPSQRNKVLDVARQGGDEPFVLLHNDVRPASGWLDRLTEDLRVCEARWGTGSSIIAPRYIPFHRLPGGFWETFQGIAQLRDQDNMTRWCAQYGFMMLPPGHEVGRTVECPPWSEPTDNGHQLMMFVTRPSFFEKVGECDEAFTGKNYDDAEWGMRALLAGKRSLISQTGLMGHIEDFTFSRGEPQLTADNEKVFIAKWGRALFYELSSGAIWPRLHREQGA